MSDARAEKPMNAAEAETLVGFLNHHRDTLRLKTEGLDADQLDTRLAPSTLTLGGLLKHLALVEDWWFSCSLLGNPAMAPFTDVDWDAAPDWESDVVLAAVLPEGLDRVSVRVGPRGEQPSTRWVLVHMIEEYARHNGHADLIRESIDGVVGQ